MRRFMWTPCYAIQSKLPYYLYVKTSMLYVEILYYLVLGHFKNHD